MTDVDAWAAARLVSADGAELTAIEARVDYIGWNSDAGRGGPKRAPRAAVNAGIVKAGGRRGFTETRFGPRTLIFRDIGLRPLALPPAPKARRSPGEPATDEQVLTALHALKAHGLVRGTRTLDVAYLRLSGSPHARLCMECGVITRHERALHVACARRRRRERGRR